jgi:hypothetical protein
LKEHCKSFCQFEGTPLQGGKIWKVFPVPNGQRKSLPILLKKAIACTCKALDMVSLPSVIELVLQEFSQAASNAFIDLELEQVVIWATGTLFNTIY